MATFDEVRTAATDNSDLVISHPELPGQTIQVNSSTYEFVWSANRIPLTQSEAVIWILPLVGSDEWSTEDPNVLPVYLSFLEAYDRCADATETRWLVHKDNICALQMIVHIEVSNLTHIKNIRFSYRQFVNDEATPVIPEDLKEFAEILCNPALDVWLVHTKNPTITEGICHERD